MQLPFQLLNSLCDIRGFDKDAFEKVHASREQITSIRINPTKKSQIPEINSKVPWSEFGYYLNSRPSFTFDPLFHAGCYYVQEASSMFVEQAFKQLIDLSRPIRVLDLSAAPGGKSTHIQSLISRDSLLVSNDVIRSRVNILKDNIVKWGCKNVMVTNNDPRDFATLENYFDVIVVDAPCSGSGLFRREPEAMAEWSLNNVQLCCQRQQRILANVWPALKKDGLLIYSTCSYSKEENEDIVDWMVSQLAVAYCQLSVENSWGIIETPAGYRFWPDKVKGEGFFISCFRKVDGEKACPLRTGQPVALIARKEMELIKDWAVTGGHNMVKSRDLVYAWPEQMSHDFNLLLNHLRVAYSGTIIGAIVRDKLIPDHALAMSLLKRESIKSTELTYEQAIAYLKRQDLRIEILDKGWQLVTFEGHPLGWINALSNRINNYYPREFRILKDL